MEILIEYANRFNRAELFECDPIIFPKHFAKLYHQGKASLADIEIAGIVAAHLAWGRRDMIVRDCTRAMAEMQWKPYKYVMSGEYRNDHTSLHRTVMWSEFAAICCRLKDFYTNNTSLESLTIEQIRSDIFGQKPSKSAANKKINMFRRWMVRNDGIIDLGLWRNTSPADLIIPLDVHVHRTALLLGLTQRTSADYKCAIEITEALKRVFPEDPCLGDFALFGYGVTNRSTSLEDEQ